MKRQQRNQRDTKPKLQTGRVIKEKFMQDRELAVRAKPLVPMNQKQQEYIDLINTKPVIIATGYAGTSKSYISTVMAADMYKLGQVDKILITRPAVSNSNSLGYFGGSVIEKLTVWLGAVVPVLKERLGTAMFNIAVEKGDIEFIPLEVVKGLSLNNVFFICEEASDLTKDEVVKLITRMGKDSRLVLSGDLAQSELKQHSGLSWLVGHLNEHQNLNRNFGFIDFNSVDDIVRSPAVKDFIISLIRQEKYK